jgi:hypothetical protein
MSSERIPEPSEPKNSGKSRRSFRGKFTPKHGIDRRRSLLAGTAARTRNGA